MLTIARSRAQVPPKSLGTRSRMSMLSRPTYGVASRNAISPFFTCSSVHAARLAVEDDVVDAVHADERREVVAGVGVEQHARFGRPRGGVAARGAGDDAGEDAGAENQRDVGMERRQRLVEQPVQVEHVRAAPGRAASARPAAACSRAGPRGARGRRTRSPPASGTAAACGSSATSRATRSRIATSSSLFLYRRTGDQEKTR